jgi:hypothetical protein
VEVERARLMEDHPQTSRLNTMSTSNKPHSQARYAGQMQRMKENPMGSTGSNSI